MYLSSFVLKGILLLAISHNHMENPIKEIFLRQNQNTRPELQVKSKISQNKARNPLSLLRLEKNLYLWFLQRAKEVLGIWTLS